MLVARVLYLTCKKNYSVNQCNSILKCLITVSY